MKTLSDCIGNTPLVRLQRINAGAGNTMLVKLEGDNPAGSVKDRPALWMIRGAEERGEIRPGDRLIEATSGNTGIALAMAAAIRGYRMTLIMPENMSLERRAVMRFLTESSFDDRGNTPIKEIMIGDPITIAPERPSMDAVQLMRRHRISALPVVRDDQLVGIITERDFLNIAGELLDDSFGDDGDG